MNRVTRLLGIQVPIVQAGMIWCSGWKLAAAVSNAGGLGLIGSGSMDADTLRLQIRKCKAATEKPFGVNIPLLFSESETFIQILAEEQVNVVFSSAGNPARFTAFLHDHGVKVVHVVANVKAARKCEEVGVDAIVAEGFEAGGHNGKEETTTMVLIPLIREAVSLPLIAAGGIASGKSMLAAFALGAEGVQIGSRFIVSEESSAHAAFKEKIISSSDGDTFLMLKKLVPVRLLKNKFFEKIEAVEQNGGNADELRELLGRGRARKGMFEGDMEEGELEVGQVSALIHEIRPAGEIVDEIMYEFLETQKTLAGLSFQTQ